MKLETSITVDVISNEDGTYNTYISHEGSSGEQYDDIDAKTIGEYVADLVDCLEEAASGNLYLTSDQQFVLVASNGSSMDSTIYNSQNEAYEAMKSAVEAQCTRDVLTDESSDSWLGPNAAYLCSADEGVDSIEDWIWTIIAL